MKSKTIKIIVFIFFIGYLTCLKTYAQNLPFTGTWVQKDKVSLSGPDFANGLPKQLVLEQSTGKLAIARTSIAGDPSKPDVTYNEALDLNGQKSTYDISPTRRKESMLIK